jgi:hypothetical protein
MTYSISSQAKTVKYDTICGFLFVGWLLHYFPFYLMRRQLFLHHYLPALYLSILLLCAVFDFATSTLRPRVRLQIAAVIAVCAIWTFRYFSPMVYGSPWTRADCEKAKWLKTWDFSWCVTFVQPSFRGCSHFLCHSRSYLEDVCLLFSMLSFIITDTHELFFFLVFALLRRFCANTTPAGYASDDHRW